MGDQQHQGEAERFEAAIARHNLDLQTQLKRTTSLPSAMFDAQDPMLEARLCAATEGIFQELLAHDGSAEPTAQGHKILETVLPHELTAALHAALHGEFDDDAQPRLADGMDAEFTAVLCEAAARSMGPAQARASAELKALAQGQPELQQLTHELQRRLDEAIDQDAAQDPAALDALLRAVVQQALQKASDDGGPA